MFDAVRSVDEAQIVENEVKCWVCGMVIDNIGTLYTGKKWTVLIIKLECVRNDCFSVRAWDCTRLRESHAQCVRLESSDNVINLHKWHGWKKFQKYCTIVVFPRKGYLKKMLISKAYRLIKKDKLIFLKSRIANISSSKIRKNYLIFS